MTVQKSYLSVLIAIIPFLTVTVPNHVYAATSIPLLTGYPDTTIPGTEMVIDIHGEELLMRSASPGVMVLEGENGTIVFEQDFETGEFTIKSTFSDGLPEIRGRVAGSKMSRHQIKKLHKAMENSGVRINGWKPTYRSMEEVYLRGTASDFTINSRDQKSEFFFHLLGIQPAYANSAACYVACQDYYEAAGIIAAGAIYVCGSVVFTAGFSLPECLIAAGASWAANRALQRCLDRNAGFCAYQDQY